MIRNWTGAAIVFWTLTAALAVTTPVAAAEPAQATQAAATVTWSPSLAGPSRADLEKASKQVWPDAYDTRDAKTGEERQISSCHDVLAAPLSFEPATDLDLRALQGDRVRCRVISLLLAAKPAVETHVGRFVLDDASLGQLPASLIPTPSPDEGRRLEAAGARGTSWKKADAKARIVKKKPDNILVESPKTRAILTLLGRGDLDGDGVEDLAIERAGGPRKGTWSSTEAFVLTRGSDNAPLEVVLRIR